MDNDDVTVRKRRDVDDLNLEKKYLNLHLILRTISSIEKLTKNREFGSTLRSIVASNSEETFDQNTSYEIIQNGFFVFICTILSGLIFWANRKINALLSKVIAL